MKKYFLYLIVGCSLILTGCGYSTRSALPGNLRTVHVKPFKNKINFTTERRRNVYFPLLEVNVRNAIIDRFLFDGNLRIDETDSADLVLTGELREYRRSALRFTDNDDVQEYRVQIVVDMVLMDTAKNEPLWEEKGFVGEATYFIEGSQATPESSAVSEATIDLARRVVERTIENW